MARQLAFSDSATDLTNNPPRSPASGSACDPNPSCSIARVTCSSATWPPQTTTLITAAPDGTLVVRPGLRHDFATGLQPRRPDALFQHDNPLVASDTNGVSDIYAATAPFATPGEIHFASWQYQRERVDGQAVITVVRNAPFDAAASVDYSVQDGTAMAGTDYQATIGHPDFAAGQSSATFSIPLYAAASFTDTRDRHDHPLQSHGRNTGCRHRDA